MQPLQITSPSLTDSSLFQIFTASGRDDLNWEPYNSDGRKNVSIKRLYDARVNGKGPAAALLKYAPGAQVPAHLHTGYELIDGAGCEVVC